MQREWAGTLGDITGINNQGRSEVHVGRTWSLQLAAGVCSLRTAGGGHTGIRQLYKILPIALYGVSQAWGSQGLQSPCTGSSWLHDPASVSSCFLLQGSGVLAPCGS